MNNNLSPQDNYSRFQAIEKPSYELLFMTKKYGVSPTEVLETIELVGKNRTKVEDRLRLISKRNL